MFCSKCGEKINENMNFCGKCGNLIQDNNSFQLKNKKKYGIIVAIIVGIIGISSFFLFYVNRDKNAPKEVAKEFVIALNQRDYKTVIQSIQPSIIDQFFMETLRKNNISLEEGIRRIEEAVLKEKNQEESNYRMRIDVLDVLNEEMRGNTAEVDLKFSQIYNPSKEEKSSVSGYDDQTNTGEATISLIKENKKWYVRDLADIEIGNLLHSLIPLMAN